MTASSKRSINTELKHSISSQDPKRTFSSQDPKRSISSPDTKRSFTAQESKRSTSSQDQFTRPRVRKSSPSVTSQSGKYLYRLSPVDEAIAKFRSICQKYQWLKMPILVAYDEKKCYTSDHTNEPKIWLSFKKHAQEQLLDKVIVRNETIENNTFAVLVEWQRLQASLTTLKMENCALTSAQVILLVDLIKADGALRDLSLNGNPNDEQNFFLLLRENRLLSLSLKFCGINSDGIRNISEELSKPMENPLLHLNLASNALYDEGAEYVAKFLRINRVLLSLNLADNKIQNVGCLLLIEPLQKFCLNHNEMIIRRRIKFEIHKSIKAGTDGSKHSLIKRSLSKNSKKSSKEKSSHSSQSLRKKSSTSWCMVPETTYHPFIQDIEELDSEIYCKGNDTLTNLNLSYNRIKQEGLRIVINMLDYQKQNYANDKGISRISLEGNDVNGLSEIEKLLAKKSRSLSIHSNRSSRVK